MKNKSLILVLSLILTSTTHLLAKDFGNLIAYYTFDNIKNKKAFHLQVKQNLNDSILILRRHTHMVILTSVSPYGERFQKALTITLELVL